jgi:hypothetical protein
LFVDRLPQKMRDFWRAYAIETWGPVAMCKSGMPARNDGHRDGVYRRTSGAAAVLVRIPDEEALCESGGCETALASHRETKECPAQLSEMNRRRSERVLLQVRLFVEAEYEPRKIGRINAFTLVVNAHGGLLEISLKLTKGQKLLLSNPAFEVEERATVVAVRAAHEGSFTVAFEFDKAAPRFWPISFPPKDWGLVEAEN